MVWFIIGFIVAVAIIIKKCCDEWEDLEDKILSSMATLLTAFLISLIVFVVSSAITTCCAEIDYYVESDTKIIALKDNQNVSGSFYILGGYIDEELYYYYAAETEFGYKTEKIKADKAYIKYADGNSHIERHKAKFVNNISYLLGVPIYDDVYVIYCPEGTVTNEFNVDLE